MATYSTPVLVYVATIDAGQSVVASGNYTATFSISGWEANLPVRIRYGGAVSGDPQIWFYRAADGVNYDTDPFTSFSVAAQVSANRQNSIVLPTGQYVLRVLASGATSQSVQILTRQEVTAIQNA